MTDYDNKPVYLTDEDVRGILHWDLLIPVIEKALRTVSSSDSKTIVAQPVRTIMPVPGKNGVLLTMPGYSAEDDALACKLVTSFPENSFKGMKSVQGTILLFHTETGKLYAIIEANEITAQRTAAASVVATRYLHQNADVLAVLGSGTQARSHLRAFLHTFQFKEIRVWNHRREGAQNLALEFKCLKKHIQVCDTVEDAVANADVIVTATYASTPILERKWIKEGVHINAVGAGINHHSELDQDLYKAASIYTDTMPAAEVELKGLADYGVQILGEIGEIIAGTKRATRENITVFHSLGMAVEDALTAKLIYDQHKINTQFSF